MGRPAKYYLLVFGKQPLTEWKFALPRHELENGMRFHVEVLDTWNMRATPVAEPITVRRQDRYVFVAEDERSIELPGRPWMALRIVRAGEE